MSLLSDAATILGQKVDSPAVAQFVSKYMGVPQRKSDEDGVGYLISVPRGLELALDFEEVSGIFVYVNGYNGYHDFTGDFGLPGALREMRAEDFRRHWGEPKGVRPADTKLGGIVFENSAERFEVGDLSIMCEFDRQGILRMIAISRRTPLVKSESPSTAKRSRTTGLAPRLGKEPFVAVMTKHDVKAELERVASGPDFLSRVADMTSEWSSQLLGLGTVRAVLEFMEQRPDLYFGSPGPLVHFVERFYGKGYEKELLASIQRKPTVHTVWMLNRVINGVRSAEERRRLIDTLDATRHHPLADRDTIEEAKDFYRSHLFR